MKKVSQPKIQSYLRFLYTLIILAFTLVLGACNQSDVQPQEPDLSPLAAGDLDATFSGDGFIDTDLEPGNDSARKVSIQTDGKLVLGGTTGAGNYGVVRYKADGSGLDLGFDGDGKRIIDMGSASDKVKAMTMQVDGKIIVVGEVAGGFGKDVGIARLNSNGSLDTTFSGDGKGYYDFNHFKDDYVTGVAMQGSKIVVSGWVQLNSGSDATAFAVMRLNSDGSPDLSFNGSGVKLVSFSSEGFFSAKSQAVMIANNKIIVVGRAEVNPFNWYMAAARLNNNGSLDNSFSGNGLTAFNFMEFFAPCNVGFENEAFSLATNPSIPAGTDPGFVMVGRTNACGNSDVAVARLSANGNLDNSFSSDGKRILGDANYEVALSVRTSDWVGGNKITLAGYRNGGVGGSDFQVMRLNWNGSSDTSFSGDGKLTTDFNGSHDRAYSLNLSGNKIYVAGETRNGASYEFVIARYNAN